MNQDLIVRGLDAYYGAAHVLYGVDFGVHGGAATALLGRNGVGKSTLLKSIAGATGIRRTGEIRLSEFPLTNMPPHKVVKTGVVLVPEDRRIFTDLSVEENVRLGALAATKERPPLHFAEVAELFPLLQKLRDRKGDQLSGGEQQLVAIARAVAGNPTVLLMDEPSAGLAPIILKNVRDSIRNLRQKRGITMVVAEQNADFALELCDQVTVIESGRIQLTCTVEEFRRDGSLATRFLGIS